MANVLRDAALGGGACGPAGAQSVGAVGRLANQVATAQGSAMPWDTRAGAGPGFLAGPAPGPSGATDIQRIANADVLREARAFDEGWRSARGGGGGNDVRSLVDDFGRQARLQPSPHARAGHASGMSEAGLSALGGMVHAFLHKDFGAAMSFATGDKAAAIMSGASPLERARFQHRSAVLARQMFATEGAAGQSIADRQVGELMRALRLDATPLWGNQTAHFEGAWANASVAGTPQAQEFVRDFHAQRPTADAALAPVHAQAWAQATRHPGVGPGPGAAPWMAGGALVGASSGKEFAQGQPSTDARESLGDRWAHDFGEGVDRASQREGPLSEAAIGANTENELLNHTRVLEAAMASSMDPKMRQSKFLDFVSKMNTGELKISEDGVVPSQPGASDQGEAWAADFGASQAAGRGDWASQFVASSPEAAVARVDPWVNDFEGNWQSKQDPAAWADEFYAKAPGPGGLPDAWAEEFAQAHPPASDAGLGGYGVEAMRARYQYRFQEANPFKSHADPFALGSELYRTGLLSEAALALEAAITQGDHVTEAWRLLGQTHAENDDDPQAIAAMVEAHAAAPGDLDVLLELGVSHTNELDRQEALSYLTRWLSQHPTHAPAVNLDTLPPEGLGLEDTIGVFGRLAEANPRDADLHTALGVLFNISRDYAKAELAFRRALEIRPANHSLWNKLGATQANSSNSKEAVKAYQQALNLKANYVRAWSNMGIGFSNQGLYREAVPYYVRALSMHPNGEQLWGYLKIALTCSGMLDAVHLVNQRNIAALSKEFPI